MFLLINIFFCITFIPYYYNLEYKTNFSQENSLSDIYSNTHDELKTSSIVAILNLTNPDLNNTAHFRKSVITIEGKLYKPIPPPPPYNNLTNYNVSIVVDDELDLQYSATTDEYGEFQINYQIPLSLKITSSHKKGLTRVHQTTCPYYH